MNLPVSNLERILDSGCVTRASHSGTARYLGKIRRVKCAVSSLLKLAKCSVVHRRSDANSDPRDDGAWLVRTCIVNDYRFWSSNCYTPRTQYICTCDTKVFAKQMSRQSAKGSFADLGCLWSNISTSPHSLRISPHLGILPMTRTHWS